MPAFQSVPAYKIIRVTARIGIVIFCRTGNRNCGKEVEDLLPTAIAAASAAMVGVPTADIGGLIVVGIKVAIRLSKIYGGASIPLDAESKEYFNPTHSFPHRDGTWLEGNMEQDVEWDMDITRGKADQFVRTALGDIIGWGLGQEIISIILEEFPIHRLGMGLAATLIPGFDLAEFDIGDFDFEDVGLDKLFGEDFEEALDELTKEIFDEEDGILGGIINELDKGILDDVFDDLFGDDDD